MKDTTKDAEPGPRDRHAFDGDRDAARPAGRTLKGSGSLHGRLTARELEVLALLAEGLSNKMISRRLGISAATVKCHIGKVFGALGVASRLEAVIVAARLGLLGDALARTEGERARR